MRKVKYVLAEDYAILSIDRPEALNALNREIIDDLDEMIEKVNQNESLRVLILYSETNFAAGADIKNMVDLDEERAYNFTFSPTYDKIENMKIPVIAAIEGYALGGGLELAMAADIRIASSEAQMGFPEVKLGIFPGAGGTVRAPKAIGPAIAKELIFTGNVIHAQRALQVGLVNEVVEPGQVLEAAVRMARTIAKRGPIAVSKAKEVINMGLAEPSMEKSVENEARVWASLFATEDQKEGMRAFIEKRSPDFKNK